MRAVIQRVTEASVKIKGTTTGKISQGFLILLGIEENDTFEDLVWLSGKISRLRVFNDEKDMMNLSIGDIAGEILVISQFTLLASTRKGNRPSYIRAAKPEIAIPLYNAFIRQMEKETGKKVRSGEFGAMMEISLINDGPVTILFDTKNKE